MGVFYLFGFYDGGLGQRFSGTNLSCRNVMCNMHTAKTSRPQYGAQLEIRKLATFQPDLQKQIKPSTELRNRNQSPPPCHEDDLTITQKKIKNGLQHVGEV